MARAGKTRKVASGFSVRLVILALLLALGWQVWRMQDQLTAAKAQEQQLRQQVQTQQQENDALRSDLAKKDDESFIKALARDLLGLAEEGERIFYDVND